MIDLKRINLDKLSFFRFKELNEAYVLTDEIGEYVFLRADGGQTGQNRPALQRAKE